MKQESKIREVSFIGVMAAAVYVASAFLQIPIPTVLDNTRLHLGNVLCLLSGMLLGPVQGGVAAGLGSMFFDLTNPAYVTSAPFTFVFKFLMAWLCGRIATGRGLGGRQRYVAGAAAGSSAYVALYLAKSFAEHRYVMGIPAGAVLVTVAQKAAVSAVNAVVSVVVVVPLGLALGPAVKRLRG